MHIETAPKAFTDLTVCINVQTPVPRDTAHLTTLVTYPDYTPVHAVGVADPARKPNQAMNQVSHSNPPCLGISDAYVLHVKSKYKDEYVQGFYHLVSNAFIDKAHYISTHCCWPHDVSIVGCLRETNCTWDCRETTSESTPSGLWSFFRNMCFGDSAKSGLCLNCHESRRNFLQKCRAESKKSKIEEEDHVTGWLDLAAIGSPTITMACLQNMGTQILSLQRKHFKLIAATKALEEDHIEISNVNTNTFLIPMI